MNKSLLDKLIERAQMRYGILVTKLKLLELEIERLVEKRFGKK